MSQSSLLETKSLPEFFQKEVSRASRSVDLAISDHAEYYLVNLLTSFLRTEQLFIKNQQGQIEEKPLAIQYLESCLDVPSQRIQKLKKMGDVALYISGFFSESLFRKLVNVDYYMQMGHTAYSSITTLISEGSQPVLKNLYGELAQNFGALVSILTEVADATGKRSDSNLLKLYEKWLNTGSQRAKEQLCEQGIIPSELATTKSVQ